MRDKVLGFGWPFRPCWSSNSMRKPRLFDWTDDPRAATADVAVYIGPAIKRGIDAPGRKIAWILESPEIARRQQTTSFIERSLERIVSSYEVVLTSERELCKLHPKIAYHPAGANLPWIPEEQYAIYKKSKLCSMFASNKKVVPAHLYRHQVAERLKGKLDLFGGACNSPRIGGRSSHPDKREGLVPYMFQVVMENAKVDLYYTEKITDCFATGTVPIYWGPDRIGELFDTNGIIPFDDAFDVGSLSEDLYYEMMPAIRNNFDLVRALEGTDDLLYRKYIRRPRTDEKIGPWKPGTCVVLHREPRARAVATVPWDPWDPRRVLACQKAVATSERERLHVVTAVAKKTVGSLHDVPADQVVTRRVTSILPSPRSTRRGELGVWPQLTTAFLLHLTDAFIGDNIVFDRERYYTMGRWWSGRRWQDYAGTQEVRHVDAAVSIGAWGGEAFQHFVIDALPALASVIDLLETREMAHVRIVSHNEPQKAAQWFWNRLGLIGRIVSKPRNVRSRFVIHADLVLFSQFEPNLNQLGLYPRDTLRPIQRRIGTLRPAEQDLVVYLQRPKHRSVANEQQLLSSVRRSLEGTGLRLHVFAGGRSPGDGVDVMKRARVVFGPHGGAFANLIFAQPGTQVIELVPSRYLLHGSKSERLSMYYGLAQAAGMDYWFVEPERFEHGKPGMVVDVDEVVEVVRRCLESSL